MPLSNIFIVFVDDPSSTSGIQITGVFDHMAPAISFAESEGPDYKVVSTSFGPIDWNKFSPLPKVGW